MIKSYAASSVEVRTFREQIYLDLGLNPEDLCIFDNATPLISDPLAYWYSDQKFITNGFDEVLLYYYDGEAVGMCGGTLHNQYMYRGAQMYYLLKKARKIRECHQLMGRHGGMMHHQIERAKKLNCKIYFVAMHTYDLRHKRYWEGLQRDTAMAGSPQGKDRQYAAKDFIVLDQPKILKHTPHEIFYMNLTSEPNNFDELWNFENKGCFNENLKL